MFTCLDIAVGRRRWQSDGSAKYRAHLIGVLARRAVAAATAYHPRIIPFIPWKG